MSAEVGAVPSEQTTTPRLPFFERFGVDASSASRVLSRALRAGGDYSDLFFEYRIDSVLVLEDHKLKDVNQAVNLGCGIRVLRGDATGYAYTEDLSLEGLLRAADTAGAIASGGRDSKEIEVKGKATLDLYKPVAPAFDADVLAKLDLLRRADAAAHAYDVRAKRVTVSLADSKKEILVVTSDGNYASDVQPMLRFNVFVTSEQGDVRQNGVSGGGGRVGMEYFETHPAEEAGREAARIAITMLDARETPAGQFPVVLGPGDSGVLLHEAVGHGLEADFNRKKTSNYSDRIGERVASELCTIVDDGTIYSSRGSINIDDEGQLPSRNVLIENGILRGYMHDRLSNSHFGNSPSGNGRRQDYKHMPMPRMTNTLMMGGAHDPQEIIASVKFGIYASSFSGGQVDISNGDFVFSITEGYLIEDGKLTSPVKGVNLIGNGPECLTKVSMVGNDFAISDGRWTCGKEGQSVPVGVGTPTIKVDSITVGGSRA
jgi:TldD protein